MNDGDKTDSQPPARGPERRTKSNYRPESHIKAAAAPTQAQFHLKPSVIVGQTELDEHLAATGAKWLRASKSRVSSLR